MNKKLLPILVAILASAPFASAGAAHKPNILFLITDDQFKHMMNWLPEGEGKNLTPHTDSLAAEATILDRMYVTSPVCTPSRFAALTGLYPSRSRAEVFLKRMEELGGQSSVEWNTFITPNLPTLPKLLRDAGYRTGIVGKNHVVHASGLEKPEWLADPNDPETLAILQRNHEREVAALKQAGFDYAASLYYDNPDFIGVKALASHNLDWIAKGALDFLARGDERPFFLWCAVTVPHGPGAPERSWNADPRITALGMLEEPLDVLPPRESIPQRLKEAGIRDNTRANLLWLDDMVGALVAKLKETGAYDNTVIVYFNDHGQRAKGTVYEGGVHSEAFIRRPQPFGVGARLSEPVSNIDFTPTLLEMADVGHEGVKFDGVSFLPLLENPEITRKEALFFELGFVRGVLHDGWKYIALRYPEPVANMPVAKRQRVLDRFNANQERRGRPVYTRDPMALFSHVQAIPGGGDAEHKSMDDYPAFYDADQLYYLPEDPNEQVNLANSPDHAERLEEMKKLLSRHLVSLPGSFGDLAP
jgi:arylsulfatase A